MSGWGLKPTSLVHPALPALSLTAEHCGLKWNCVKTLKSDPEAVWHIGPQVSSQCYWRVFLPLRARSQTARRYLAERSVPIATSP
jgi:hypothetical protein